MANFLVYADNVSKFESKLKVIQKKAQKLGITPPTYAVVRKFDREFTENGRKFYLPYVEIEVNDNVVKLDGWTFAAAVDHREGGNIIRTNPNYTGSVDLASFHSAKSICEHCSSQRQRNTTYVMAKDSGEVKQIGSSCIKDFLGHPSAEYYARLFEYLRTLEEKEEHDSWPRWKIKYEVRDVVEIAAMFIRMEGYISRKMPGASTSARTFDYLDMQPFLYKQKHNTDKPEVTDEDKKVANDAIEAVKAFSEDDLRSVFNRNLRTLVEAGVAESGDFGILCYLPELFLKTLVEKIKKWEADKAAKANALASDYIGAVGDKLELEAVYVGKIYLGNNGFNDSYLQKFQVGGNAVVWSTANDLSDLNVGQTVKIKGTVKAHNLYRDVKQTKLTRCKIL